MADNALSSILSSLSGATAFTAIDESSGVALWRNVNVKSVDITSDAGITVSPASNAQYRDATTFKALYDEDLQSYKIIRPSSVKATLFCTDISDLEAVIQSFANTTLMIQLTTKSVIIPHLSVMSLDIEQTSEMLSATKISIEMEQVEPQAIPAYDPQQSSDSSVYGVRIQSLSPSSFTLTNLTAKVAQKIGPIIAPITGALLGSHGEPFVLDSSKLS
jgi:hypothetical protein